MGLIFADLLAPTPYPSFSAPDGEIVSYFRESPGQVRALSLLHGLAAMALAVFAVHLSTVVRRSNGRAQRPAALVLVSGAIAAAFLLLSSGLFWVLALPATTANPQLLRVLLALSYLFGGPPGLLLPLALFVGTSSRMLLHARLLPIWLARAGMVFGVAGIVGSFLLLDHLMGLDSPLWKLFLLPTVMLGVLWVLVTSLLLARQGGG